MALKMKALKIKNNEKGAIFIVIAPLVILVTAITASRMNRFTPCSENCGLINA
jgi:hypothetical protein